MTLYDWIITYEASFSGDIFKGLMLVKNNTRDDAESFTKSLLEGDGYKLIRLASQTINRALQNPIFKFEVYTGEREEVDIDNEIKKMKKLSNKKESKLIAKDEEIKSELCKHIEKAEKVISKIKDEIKNE